MSDNQQTHNFSDIKTSTLTFTVKSNLLIDIKNLFPLIPLTEVENNDFSWFFQKKKSNKISIPSSFFVSYTKE